MSTPPITIENLLNIGRKKLAHISTSAALETHVLLAHVLNVDQAYLIAYPEKQLLSHDINRFQSLIARRTGGEPIAYILGKKEFWSLSLEINPNVLVPRPETEILVEIAIHVIKKNKLQRVLELGTGSGAIALAIASENKNCRIIASDKSNEALCVARKNSESLGFDNVYFKHSDWYNAIDEKEFDLIVCNPPYLSLHDSLVEEQVKKFEPRQALFSELNGLADLNKIISGAPEYLIHNGYLIVEHGFSQGSNVRQQYLENGFSDIHTLKDFNQHERTTVGRLAKQ